MLSLSLGAEVQLFDPQEVQAALAKSDSAHEEGLRKTYRKMLERGPQRWLSRPRDASLLQPLEQQCPNFSAVLQDLARYIELSAVGRQGLSVLPILLAGDPGVGKTHFAKALAKALGLPFQFVSMGTVTAGWVLSGSAASWSGARQGKVAQGLLDNELANPVVLVDELDKTGGDSRYDPFGALLQLMERETARHFKDEFLDVDLDASSVVWLATANQEERIPDYIRSRMVVYHVPAPTPEQAAVIAANVYEEQRQAYDWPFSGELSSGVLERLVQVPPREMKKQILDAMAQAVAHKRTELQPDDVPSRSGGARKLGFL